MKAHCLTYSVCSCLKIHPGVAKAARDRWDGDGIGRVHLRGNLRIASLTGDEKDVVHPLRCLLAVNQFHLVLLTDRNNLTACVHL